MLELYINNKLVDLNEETKILLNKDKTSYDNPTIIKNVFSRSITLNATVNNEKIFNSIWKLDRTQANNSFNPSQRVKFVLKNNEALIESGYVKLDNINCYDDTHTYDITLYGELGDLLYSLIYSTDSETYEDTKRTLADLTFDSDLGFTINKETVKTAWLRLNDLDGSTTSIYDTLNFAVCYDGVPDATKFAADKCLVRIPTGGWTGQYIWKNNLVSELPTSLTEDSKTFTPLTFTGKTGGYAQMEINRDCTCLEMRDFRSYLTRPVIRVKKLMVAIQRMCTSLGYTLDLSDDFFDSQQYKYLWFTLHTMYNINKEVESGYKFTQKELLSKTNSPAEYLISICKTFCLFIDLDIDTKTLHLRSKKNFYKRNNKIAYDTINLVDGTKPKITPLSFNKSYYQFAWGVGDSEFIAKYKNDNKVDYGVKNVFTRYQFSGEFKKYIDNNIFNNGVDVLEQSEFYRDVFVPAPIAPRTYTAQYNLFNIGDGGTITSAGDTIQTAKGQYLEDSTTTGLRYVNGFIGTDENSATLDYSLWQDCYPRLQCHTEDNSAAEGNNILVTSSNFYAETPYILYAQVYNGQYGTNFESTDVKARYILSDDAPLNSVIEKHCWLSIDESPQSTTTGGQNEFWYDVQDIIPVFSRYRYSGADYYEFNYRNATELNANSTSHQGSKAITRGLLLLSATQSDAYLTFNLNTLINHKYLVLGSGYTLGNPITSYFTMDNGVVNEYLEVKTTSYPNVFASIITANSSGVSSIQSPHMLQGTALFMRFLYVVDLTHYNMNDITLNEAMIKFGNTPGNSIVITEALDFGEVRELYVPATTYDPDTTNIVIYDKIWKSMISDLYDVNTRLLEAKVIIDDIKNAFHKFYSYDNALFILSSFDEWDPETHQCTAKFIKVNNIENYTA